MFKYRIGQTIRYTDHPRIMASIVIKIAEWWADDIPPEDSIYDSPPSFR